MVSQARRDAARRWGAARGGGRGGMAAEESPAAGLVCFFWEKKAVFVS